MPFELYARGGTWWVRGRPDDGGEYVRKSLGTSRRDFAEADVRELNEAARVRRLLGPNAPKPEDEITFGACVALYPAKQRDAAYLRPIVRRIGKKKVREITPGFIRDHLAPQMLPLASTDTWQRQVVTPVRSVINNAHGLGKCPPIRVKAYSTKERVAQDVVRGRQSRLPRTPGSWKWVEAFCAAADPRDAALAYFMFRHGYRVGQSVAMTRAADMDLGAGLARVHASKGHPAHWVKLDPEEVVMIANLAPPYRHAGADRVFRIPSARNGALYQRWRLACKTAGIEYLSPHAAGRHGYGTEMVVRQRVDPVSAAKDKWSDPSVMLKTYAHSSDSEEIVREAMAAGRDAARAKVAKTGNDR